MNNLLLSRGGQNYRKKYHYVDNSMFPFFIKVECQRFVINIIHTLQPSNTENKQIALLTTKHYYTYVTKSNIKIINSGSFQRISSYW